jgi:uridylate kinase
MSKETIIISLGGSLVVPDGIDIDFLKKFKACLERYFKTKRFFIIVGGGKTARIYQNAILQFGANDIDKDWIGIGATRLNAEVIRQVFNSNAHSEIITDPTKKIDTIKNIVVGSGWGLFKKPQMKDVVIGAGWKPGWSTDYDAVLIAKNHDIKTIINLTNIDYVYDKNPKEFPDAKPLKEVSWKDFEKIVGNSWVPGANKPFDPIASKEAFKLGMKVVIMNGCKLENLENFLNNKEFIGTVIQ